MTLQPWNVVYLLGFLVYFGIRYHFAKRVVGAGTTLSRFDAQDKCLLSVVAIGCPLLPVLYLFTPLLSFADYRLPAFLPWCGAVFMLAALWLFWRSHADLGRNWSVSLELRKDHQLVRHGVYRAVRHPMYASIWLFSLAQGLLLENWLAGWSAVVTFAPLYFLRTTREERMMSETFGREYDDYMARTGRLFPRIGVKPES